MNTTLKLFSCFFIFISTSVFAEVVTDGSLGAITNLSGQMIIPQSLGTTAGDNLFHSFKTFNIQTGESASFTGSENLKNVISRVTGENRSLIDGPLTSTIGRANFYFINPAGVFFGANAKVNVPAAFYVSTANTLEFADGKPFNIDKSVNSRLSIAEPTRFGFLGQTNNKIAIHGAQLSSKNVLQNFNIVAGNIEISDNADIKAEAGSIQLSAVGKSKLSVPIQGGIDTNSGAITVNNSSMTANQTLEIRGGAIAVKNNSQLVNENNGSQNPNVEQGINIVAKNLSIDSSRIQTTTDETRHGSDVNITAVEKIKVVNRGRIQSKTNGSGNAGNVMIKAKNIVVDGLGQYALISSNSENKTVPHAGAAGTVTVNSDNLKVVNGGQIYSDTWSTGDAGKVDIDAGNILIDGKGNYARISSSSNNDVIENAGNAGIVNIKGNQLSVLDGAKIYSDTFGTGNAGNVLTDVHHIRVDGKGQYTWISSDTNNPTSINAGHAGTVSIKADSLSVSRGGIVSSNTYGTGNAGNVTAEADYIRVKGKNTWIATNSINETQVNAGKAGAIHITGNSLKILKGGIISSSTYGTGNAGDIVCSVNDIVVAGNRSFISSNSQNEVIANAGNAGAIQINSNNLLLSNGGNITNSTWSSGHSDSIDINSDSLSILGGKKGSGISASAWGLGNAGNINIDADKILVDGQHKYAWISSETGSEGGHAGPIDIAGHNITLLNNGQISSDTFGPGAAGNILIASDFLTLDNSHISAIASTESQGQTGNINIAVNKVLQTSNQGNISIKNDALLANPSAVKAGAINVSAPNMLLKDSSITAEATGNVDAGSITTHFSHRLNLDNAFISTSAFDGNGGNIQLNGSGFINLQNSGILTSVTGVNGNGGNINVSANLLIMNTGAIQANALGGKGGDIALNLQALITSQNALIKGGTQINWQPTKIGFNVIQAASATGISGNINLTSPQLNISGVISGLDASALVMPIIDRNPCQAIGSSLTHGGKGGVPISDAKQVFVSPITVQQSLPVTKLDNNFSGERDDQPCATNSSFSQAIKQISVP